MSLDRGGVQVGPFDMEDLDLEVEEYLARNGDVNATSHHYQFAKSILSLFTCSGYHHLVNKSMKMALITKDIECFALYMLLRRFHIPCDLFLDVLRILEEDQNQSQKREEIISSSSLKPIVGQSGNVEIDEGGPSNMKPLEQTTERKGGNREKELLIENEGPLRSSITAYLKLLRESVTFERGEKIGEFRSPDAMKLILQSLYRTEFDTFMSIGGEDIQNRQTEKEGEKETKICNAFGCYFQNRLNLITELKSYLLNWGKVDSYLEFGLNQNGYLSIPYIPRPRMKYTMVMWLYMNEVGAESGQDAISATLPKEGNVRKVGKDSFPKECTLYHFIGGKNNSGIRVTLTYESDVRWLLSYRVYTCQASGPDRINNYSAGKNDNDNAQKFEEKRMEVYLTPKTWHLLSISHEYHLDLFGGSRISVSLNNVHIEKDLEIAFPDVKEKNTCENEYSHQTNAYASGGVEAKKNNYYDLYFDKVCVLAHNLPGRLASMTFYEDKLTPEHIDLLMIAGPNHPNLNYPIPVMDSYLPDPYLHLTTELYAHKNHRTIEKDDTMERTDMPQETEGNESGKIGDNTTSNVAPFGRTSNNNSKHTNSKRNRMKKALEVPIIFSVHAKWTQTVGEPVNYFYSEGMNNHEVQEPSFVSKQRITEQNNISTTVDSEKQLKFITMPTFKTKTCQDLYDSDNPSSSYLLYPNVLYEFEKVGLVHFPYHDFNEMDHVNMINCKYNKAQINNSHINTKNKSQKILEPDKRLFVSSKGIQVHHCDLSYEKWVSIGGINTLLVVSHDLIKSNVSNSYLKGVIDLISILLCRHPSHREYFLQSYGFHYISLLLKKAYNIYSQSKLMNDNNNQSIKEEYIFSDKKGKKRNVNDFQMQNPLNCEIVDSIINLFLCATKGGTSEYEDSHINNEKRYYDSQIYWAGMQGLLFDFSLWSLAEYQVQRYLLRTLLDKVIYRNRTVSAFRDCVGVEGILDVLRIYVININEYADPTDLQKEKTTMNASLRGGNNLYQRSKRSKMDANVTSSIERLTLGEKKGLLELLEELLLEVMMEGMRNRSKEIKEAYPTDYHIPNLYGSKISYKISNSKINHNEPSFSQTQQNSEISTSKSNFVSTSKSKNSETINLDPIEYHILFTPEPFSNYKYTKSKRLFEDLSLCSYLFTSNYHIPTDIAPCLSFLHENMSRINCTISMQSTSQKLHSGRVADENLENKNIAFTMSTYIEETMLRLLLNIRKEHKDLLWRDLVRLGFDHHIAFHILTKHGHSLTSRQITLDLFTWIMEKATRASNPSLDHHAVGTYMRTSPFSSYFD